MFLIWKGYLLFCVSFLYLEPILLIQVISNNNSCNLDNEVFTNRERLCALCVYGMESKILRLYFVNTA